MRPGLRARYNRRHVDDSTLLEMKIPAHSADLISGCAILLAGVVGGVLVFVVALPLALSSPFPTPRQGKWVIENSAFDEVSALRASPMLPPQEAAGPPAQQPKPIIFAERWSLTVPQTAATAAPSASDPPSVEVPAEAVRLAPLGNGLEVPLSTLPRLRGREGRPSVRISDPV